VRQLRDQLRAQHRVRAQLVGELARVEPAAACSAVHQPATLLLPANPRQLRRKPWFIYLFGGAGALLFLTASLGVLSADCVTCGITCFVGLYHALLFLQLLLQAGVIGYCLFDKSWQHNLPHDETGFRRG